VLSSVVELKPLSEN